MNTLAWADLEVADSMTDSQKALFQRLTPIVKTRAPGRNLS